MGGAKDTPYPSMFVRSTMVPLVHEHGRSMLAGCHAGATDAGPTLLVHTRLAFPETRRSVFSTNATHTLICFVGYEKNQRKGSQSGCLAKLIGDQFGAPTCPKPKGTPAARGVEEGGARGRASSHVSASARESPGAASETTVLP